jgi:hypothetical protein
VDEIYVDLALFKLMGVVQKPTLTSYYSKNWPVFIPFFGSVHKIKKLKVPLGLND